MSENYITTESTPALRADAVEDTAPTSSRFTPLRSAIVVRERNARAGAGETLSPLLPVRRQHT
jgi:hypothetical protein